MSTKDDLAAAEKILADREKYGQEVAHSRSALIRAMQDGDKKAIAAASDRAERAEKAAIAANVNLRTIDEAAQKVLELREKLANEGKK